MKVKIALMAVTLAVVLAVAVIAPYFIKGPDGKPLMSADKTLSYQGSRQTFYKWQDDKGMWHFSDEVPDGVQALPVEVDTAANIVQSVPVEKKAEEDAEPAAEVAADQVSVPAGFPMTVDPAAIPQLIKDAQNVQSLVDKRSQQIDDSAR